MIELTVNGEPSTVPEGTTVAGLVDVLGTGRRGVAVAINAEVVARSTWEATLVGPGDRVEILRAVQGGC